MAKDYTKYKVEGLGENLNKRKSSSGYPARQIRRRSWA